MKKLAIVLVFLLIVFIDNSLSVPMYPDTYLHPRDWNAHQRDIDRIGTSPPFEIYGHDWIGSGSQLRIWTGWNLGLDGKALFDTQLGDVFVYTQTGTIGVALRKHDAALGEGNIQQGDIFTPSSYLTSDHYYGPGTGVIRDTLHYWNYGDHEMVLASTGEIHQYAAAIGYGEEEPGLYAITIGFPNPVYDFSNHPGIRFAYTCANDVHQVPEPSTIFLLGSGLLGLGILGRRGIKRGFMTSRPPLDQRHFSSSTSA